jgi:hypothetical protein
MEKIVLLRKQLIKTSLVAAGAVVICLILYLYLGSEVEDTVRYNQQLENDIITLQRQSTDSRNKNETTARAVKVFNTLPESQKSQPTLEDTAARIRTARPIIDELRIRYKFSSLNANFTKVEDVTKQFEIKHLKVYKNSITLDFKALTDELVFTFLDSLFKQTPGYLTLESFSLNKESEITPAVIKSLLTRQTTVPFLLSGKAVLAWYTISEIKPGEGEKAP